MQTDAFDKSVIKVSFKSFSVVKDTSGLTKNIEKVFLSPKTLSRATLVF